MDKLLQTKQPIITAAAAIYPYCDKLKKKFSLMSRFGDPFPLYKEVGQGKNHAIWLPREVCPLGESDKRVVGISIKTVSSFKARSRDQERFVKSITDLLLKGESHIAQAPTGFGKTVCCSEVIGRVGVKALIVVPKEDLIKQWRDALKMVLNLADNEIGLIQGDVCAVANKKVVIAMVHSACKIGRYPSWVYKEFGFVICDETHVMGAETFSDLMWLFPSKLRLGVSATPYRKDGKDVVFFSHIGAIKVQAHTMVLKPKIFVVESGWKCPLVPVVDKVTKQKRFEKMTITPGKSQHANKMLAKDSNRNSIIVNFVHKSWEKGRNTIIFSDLKEYHLDRLYSLLRGAGIPAKDIAYYVGGLKEAEREAAKLKPVLLATYQMAAMATDIPWLDTAVLGTPRSDVIQIVGRVLREYPDKKEPVVLDIRDSDSPTFKGYAGARDMWYLSIHARTLHIGKEA